MLTITSLRPDDWSGAAALGERAQRALGLIANGLLDARGVVIARDEGIVGMQVCASLGGNAWMFWLPIGDESIVDALVQAGLSLARRGGGKLAQSILSVDEPAPSLLRNGFQRVTTMRHLEHALIDLPPAPNLDLSFHPYGPSSSAAFAATLEQTYQGTLDCPELCGVRTIDEILAGHRGEGRFDPHYWWLVKEADRPAGVVILTELLDGITWELAYLGVTPSFRRQGLGRAMVLNALQTLRELPATRLTLAVDERNLPARRLYASIGFVETEANAVFLHFLG